MDICICITESLCCTSEINTTLWSTICCCCSDCQSCPTLCDPMNCSVPGFPVLCYLPEFDQTHVHWVNDAIQPSYPPSPLSPPLSIFPSIRVFSNKLAHRIRWPKYCSFSFSISLCSEYSGLVSFRIGWFDLAIQWTLKSLLQHRSLKASILPCPAFFMGQLSHLYMTTGKTIAFIALTKQYIFFFSSKVMSLLFNLLFRFVITFLPRSRHPLISWLQSSSPVILEPKKVKSVTVSVVFPSICHEVIGQGAMILVF